MTKGPRTTDRITVHSESELPSFASEDEEREWWETHDLGEEFQPGYEDLESLLAMGLRASEAPQVAFPLTLALRSLRTMRRPARRRGFLHDRRIQDAAAAVTFAADALEAGLNLYFLTERGPSLDAKATAHFAPKVGPRKMLTSVLQRQKERPAQSLIDRLWALLERRDVLVHGLASTNEQVRKGSPQDWDIDKAPDFVEAAETFLDQLWLSPRGKIGRGYHNESTIEDHF